MGRQMAETQGGAVAQLGERLNGIQEADSSILFSSTPPVPLLIQNRFRGRPVFEFSLDAPILAQ